MRIDALTGVRIVAALSVFFSHAATTIVPPLPYALMKAGYNGVTVFFVLSGFVLAWNYADRLGSRRELWSFFVARFARIYPLYIFCLLFAVAAIGVIPDTTLWLHALALQAWSGNIITVFAFNGPGWSIGVEFFLYACFPLVMLALRRAGRTALISTLIGAVVVMGAITVVFVLTGAGALLPEDPASAHRWLYHSPLLRLGDFVVGVVAALLLKRVGYPPAWVAYTAQAVGVLWFIVAMSDLRNNGSAWSWDVLYLPPTFLLIWGLVAGGRSPLARLLSTRPAVLLGEASFAFYLLHAPILRLIDPTQSPTLARWALTTAIALVVVTLAAIGAHIGIERPAQRWIRKTLIGRDAIGAVDVAGGSGVLQPGYGKSGDRHGQ